MITTYRMSWLIGFVILFFSMVYSTLAVSEEGKNDYSPYDSGFMGPPLVPQNLRSDMALGQVYRPTSATHGGGDDKAPQGPTSKRDRLLGELSGYEYVPTREDLDKIATGTEMEQLLLSIARDGNVPMQQTRAIAVLGYYDTPAVVAFLNRVAHDPNGKEPKGANLGLTDGMVVGLQHEAIGAVARATKSECVKYLGDLLKSEDLQLQLTTVVALGRHGGEAGRVAIRELLKGKQHPLVEEEGKRALQ